MHTLLVIEYQHEHNPCTVVSALYNLTFGIKFIPKSTVDETRQIIPIMAYFTVTMLPNSTMTGVTAIPATTMV